ncbi:uncharacterized protein LOC131862243 [Cryptomeria japonica]|uniref:uncharacterized protein LOC131862243 n=1 Tax=Cryptomeria japonica TaxID=3369 RepID=UPI0027DA13BB|nr:uncharacterized protein LOC131862243 [Cryptomeria japonica]
MARRSSARAAKSVGGDDGEGGDGAAMAASGKEAIGVLQWLWLGGGWVAALGGAVADRKKGPGSQSGGKGLSGGRGLSGGGQGGTRPGRGVAGGGRRVEWRLEEQAVADKEELRVAAGGTSNGRWGACSGQRERAAVGGSRSRGPSSGRREWKPGTGKERRKGPPAGAAEAGLTSLTSLSVRYPAVPPNRKKTSKILFFS